MPTQIATLRRDNALLKDRSETSKALVNRLRKRSDGDSNPYTGLQNYLEMRSAEVERLVGE